MKLAVAITFFYSEVRLKYLRQVCDGLDSLSESFDLFVVTNTFDSNQQSQVRSNISIGASIIVPSHLGHPFLLTWIHRDIFKGLLKKREYTHFLYLEDDILFTQANLEYWIKARQMLRNTRFVPGFVRFELDSKGHKLSTDILKPEYYNECTKILVPGSLFLGLSHCYQGMYLLDRPQALELLTTGAGSPDTGFWGIREKAAQGLTFWNVPDNAGSRILVEFDTNGNINPNALIHHLPNNYALDSNSPFGSTLVSDILTFHQSSQSEEDFCRPVESHSDIRGLKLLIYLLSDNANKMSYRFFYTHPVFRPVIIRFKHMLKCIFWSA